MNKHYLPTNYSDHDRASEALFERKSIDALIFLIDHGRELEFTYCGATYFLSCSGSQQYVSLWENGIQQSFNSMDDLIKNAKIHHRPFASVWKDVELSFLF